VDPSRSTPLRGFVPQPSLSLLTGIRSFIYDGACRRLPRSSDKISRFSATVRVFIGLMSTRILAPKTCCMALRPVVPANRRNRTIRTRRAGLSVSTECGASLPCGAPPATGRAPRTKTRLTCIAIGERRAPQPPNGRMPHGRTKFRRCLYSGGASRKIPCAGRRF
jgi:hypothetical protein